MSEERKHYVWIEVVGDGPLFKRFDAYLTRWKGVGSLLTDHLEAVDVGTPTTLKMTVYWWSKAERDAFCEENDIGPWS